MGQTTQNGIEFNQVKNIGLRLGSWPVLLQRQVGPDSDGGVINAVDIDWNGAILPNANISTGGSVTINTTGQLLKLINDMQQEIYTLAAAVIAIGNNQ